VKRDIEEIADLLARVRDFCSKVGKEPLGVRDTEGRPVDDRLLLLVPQMETLCDGIGEEIGFAAMVESSAESERERMVAESAHRVDVMLESLRGALYQAKASKTAHALAIDIGRRSERRRHSAHFPRREVEVEKWVDRARKEFKETGGKPTTFAKNFVAAHPQVNRSWETVRDWITPQRVERKRKSGG
jgi:hypothetical protein